MNKIVQKINFFVNNLNLSKFRTKNYDTPLGRWNIKALTFNQYAANHDNCGDKICGDPIHLKKMLLENKD